MSLVAHWGPVSSVDLGWVEQDGKVVPKPQRRLLGFNSGTELLDSPPTLFSPFQICISASSPEALTS